MWVRFVFPLQEVLSAQNPEFFRIFIQTFPIFTSQVFLFVFISIAHGHPSTTRPSFRLSLASFLIYIFTSLDPAPQLVDSELIYLFDHPPRVDLPEITPTTQHSVVLSLPSENLDTLVDLEHRTPGPCRSWFTSGTSPLIAAGTGSKSLPLEPKQKVKVQKATAHLPPLFYDPTETAFSGKEDYAPSREPRSLLLRSERQGLAENLQKKKAETLGKRADIEKFEAEQRNRALIVRKAVLGGSKIQVEAFQTMLEQMETNGKYEITDWMYSSFPGVDTSAMKPQKDPTVKAKATKSNSVFHSGVFAGSAAKNLFFSTFL